MRAPSSGNKRQNARPRLLFVNKTANSLSLSHSEGLERLSILSTAQRTSRSGSQQRCPTRTYVKIDPSHLGDTSDPNLVDYLSTRKEPSLVFLPASKVSRLQLTANFLDAYYPCGLPCRADVVGTLLQWIQPTRGAVALAAADSLVLLHAAQQTSDPALKVEGVLRYQMAVRLLRDELQTTNCVSIERVIGAVEIMGVLETRLLKQSDREGEKVGHVHASGLQEMILNRGPSILHSTIGRNIVLNHLHEPLMISLLERKASIFGDPEWQAALQRIDGVTTSKMHGLTSLGCMIPAALEDADAIVNNQASTSRQHTNLLDRLTTIEERIEIWSNRRRRRAFCSRNCNRRYSSGDGSIVSSCQCLSKRSQITPAFQDTIYDPFLEILARMNSLGFLLILRSTMLNVLRSLEATNSVSYHPQALIPELRAQCNKTANLLCEITADVRRLRGPQENIVKQGLVAFISISVLPWYVESQNDRMVERCRNLLDDFRGENEDISRVNSVGKAWTTKLYIGWVNMIF